jgi:hypothetical protein
LSLLGALLRNGSLNLSALTQHYASHPGAALRFCASAALSYDVKPENRGLSHAHLFK